MSNNSNFGRPKKYDEPMQNFTVRLPESLVKKASELGDGNTADGIRVAIEKARAKK